MRSTKVVAAVVMIGASVLGAVLSELACVGSDPNVEPEVVDGGPSSTTEASAIDGGGGGDACAPSVCDNDDLVSCGAAHTHCALGCRPPLTTSEAARCRLFEPQGAATVGDFSVAGLTDLTLASVAIDVDTGRISEGATEIRQANDAPESGINEIKNQIAFRRDGAAGVGILIASNIVFAGPLTFVSANGAPAARPLVFVAQHQITIATALSLPCGALGGGTGGAAKQSGGGVMNSGGLATPFGGGGGGGHGSVGGAGGVSQVGGQADNGGAGGAIFNTDFSLLAGGGGGAGGSSVGGGGGGAIQLVAGESISIGDGHVVDDGGLPKGINAGGCGGDHGAPAAGGGAGGFIALEAPVINGMSFAGLAANGGGGGGFVDAGRGGTLGITTAFGGGRGSSACNAAGGAGGAGTTAAGAGQGGEAADTPDNCDGNSKGGGGGGAPGRIRVTSLSRNITVVSGGTTGSADGGVFFVSPEGALVLGVAITAEP